MEEAAREWEQGEELESFREWEWRLEGRNDGLCAVARRAGKEELARRAREEGVQGGVSSAVEG